MSCILSAILYLFTITSIVYSANFYLFTSIHICVSSAASQPNTMWNASMPASTTSTTTVINTCYSRPVTYTNYIEQYGRMNSEQYKLRHIDTYKVIMKEKYVILLYRRVHRQIALLKTTE